MVSRADYPEEMVKAALSVLVEVFALLGEYRGYIVLVGGWVPYLLFGGAKSGHIGSTDVDLALDMRGLWEEGYKTVLDLLKGHGYEQSKKQPFIFLRTFRDEASREHTVQVDLLAGEYGGTGPRHR